MHVPLSFTSSFTRSGAGRRHAGTCLACGRPVRHHDHAVRLHGAVFHGACAVYQPAGR